MKHQITFGWYAFLGLLAALNLAILTAGRIQHGPDDQWWILLMFAALLAYTATRCTRIAKKDWGR